MTRTPYRTLPTVTAATELRLSLLGSRFVLPCPDPAIGAELARLLAPFADTSDEWSGTASARPVEVPRDVDPPTALSTVLAELNRQALAEADLFAVHAAAVAREGRVVAAPAVSGTGKSTLTAACLRAGLDYVSDEALCLHWDTGTVSPYPRPIALSRWSAAELGIQVPDGAEEALLTAADLGAGTAEGGLTLAHVVLLRRGEPGMEATLEPIARGEAVAEVLRRSFTSWRRPDRAFALVHEVVGRAETWSLTLGDPVGAAGVVTELLER